MPQIRVTEDPKYGLTHKTGSITLDYGVRGPELERELRSAQEKFLRAMELRGLILYRHVGLPNPTWVENPDGSEAAFYAIDWEGKRPRIERRIGGDMQVANIRETSLEETQGEVEYRIVGIFWAPKRAVEVLTSIAERKEREAYERHPKSFGPIGTPLPSM